MVLPVESGSRNFLEGHPPKTEPPRQKFPESIVTASPSPPPPPPPESKLSPPIPSTKQKNTKNCLGITSMAPSQQASWRSAPDEDELRKRNVRIPFSSRPEKSDRTAVEEPLTDWLRFSYRLLVSTSRLSQTSALSTTLVTSPAKTPPTLSTVSAPASTSTSTTTTPSMPHSPSSASMPLSQTLSVAFSSPRFPPSPSKPSSSRTTPPSFRMRSLRTGSVSFPSRVVAKV